MGKGHRQTRFAALGGEGASDPPEPLGGGGQIHLVVGLLQLGGEEGAPNLLGGGKGGEVAPDPLGGGVGRRC
jgi:hypothetical protein